MLQIFANKELLKFAVQTAITCPRCRTILDVRTAVSITVNVPDKRTREYIACGKCYDEVKHALADTVLSLSGSIEAIDGRVLHGRKRTVKAVKRG